MTDILGAVSAGGASSRFGSPKALALVGGRRVIDRVIAALAAVTGMDNVFAIVNDPAIAAVLDVPHCADTLADAGAIAGVHAALLQARERGARGALVAGCDMPFLEPALLSHLAARAEHADVVIPESGGRRGVEPLCAYYAASCIAAIEAAVGRGDARMIGFHDAVTVERIPLDVVRRFGDPSRLFMNMNSLADLELAEQLERES
jgi:molybdopterin-guanine dinucleotide biosynthesis protein A